MKIIKQGQLPAERVYQGTCRRCTTEVEFQRGEATYHADQRDGDFLTVRCPVCNDTITVDVEQHGHSSMEKRS